MELDFVRICLKIQYKINTNLEYVYTGDAAAELFAKDIGDRNVECTSLLCLDSAYRAINYSMVSIGKIDSVNACSAEIFKIALLSNAFKIYIAHNHPSGELTATKKDIAMTKNIGAVARLFDIELIDSLIVGCDNRFVSIRKANELEVLNGEYL